MTIRVLLLTEDNQVLEAELPFTVLPIPVTYNAVMEPEEMSLRAGSADDFLYPQAPYGAYHRRGR